MEQTVRHNPKKTVNSFYEYDNRYVSKELLQSPLYDEEMMESIFEGIVQNILIEMDKKEMSSTVLAEISGVSVSHISHILCGKKKIGLSALIRIAYSLGVNPRDLLPYDLNTRKTYGQRFDEMTKSLDFDERNFLMNVCSQIHKEMLHIKSKSNQ